MLKNTQDYIKDLQGEQKMLTVQLDAQTTIIDTQKQQIRILEKKIKILEDCNNKLTEGINELVKANETLDELCFEQQTLLDEFSKMLK